MPVTKLNIEDFLAMSSTLPIIDVRSPGEFEHAHIPQAYSLPLFTNEERKVVGTAYKQESRENAIKIGLQYFGPKMVKMVEEVEHLMNDRNKMAADLGLKKDAKNSNVKSVLVHCWRGGMRSAGVAWLLDLYGFKVYTLVGGYKSFRQWANRQFEHDYNFTIIGGYTGSGKTGVLAELKKRSNHVVDLEGLANHKGSSFGSIGMPPQPTQEMFENLLALELHSVYSKYATLHQNEGSISNVIQPTINHQPPTANHPTINYQPTNIWLEDESQRIGNLNIPPPLWNQMRKATVFFLNIPFEERLNHIIKDYGKGDKEKIVSAIMRIKKRLGGLETKTAVNHLIEDDLKECFRILLTYYDKYYLKGLQNREGWQDLVKTIECSNVNPKENAMKLLNFIPQGEAR